MSSKFRELVEKMPPESRERIEVKTKLLKTEMALRDLREALNLTQEELANTLNLKQAAVSKFEHQSDIYLSTLRKILGAMGAELKIVAQFPEGDILINQFDDVRRESELREKVLPEKM